MSPSLVIQLFTFFLLTSILTTLQKSQSHQMSCAPVLYHTLCLVDVQSCHRLVIQAPYNSAPESLQVFTITDHVLCEWPILSHPWYRCWRDPQPGDGSNVQQSKCAWGQQLNGTSACAETYPDTWPINVLCCWRQSEFPVTCSIRSPNTVMHILHVHYMIIIYTPLFHDDLFSPLQTSPPPRS